LTLYQRIGRNPSTFSANLFDTVGAMIQSRGARLGQ
jgi:hypothetical protein